MGRAWFKAWVYFTFHVLFRLAHSRVRTAFKVYSTVDECGRMSSTHVQYHLCCLNIHPTHVLLYMHCLHSLKKLPAHGRCAQLSAIPPDDENYVMQTVRRCGRLKYTLAFIFVNKHYVRQFVIAAYCFLVLKMWKVYRYKQNRQLSFLVKRDTKIVDLKVKVKAHKKSNSCSQNLNHK